MRCFFGMPVSPHSAGPQAGTEVNMKIAIGIILILASVFLVAAVLMQQGKSRNLSGAISGGSSDTFLGKSGASSRDRLLSRLTTIVAIVFVVLVLIMYLIQDTGNTGNGLIKDDAANGAVTDTVDTTAETTGDASETTAA